MAMELSILELDTECGELLPAREALGVFKVNLASLSATNIAAAVALGGDHNITVADSLQAIDFSQG